MRLFRRKPRENTIRALYGAIVAQARMPAFYRAYGVSDTVEGRFDMIVLHLFLVLRRANADAASRDIGQATFDFFCEDMDDNLREMGVGDLAVPKKMRSLGEAYYGRAGSYERALTQGEPAIAAALARNVYGAAAPPPGARLLAAYVGETERRLACASSADLGAGRLDFPDPDTISGGESNQTVAR